MVQNPEKVHIDGFAFFYLTVSFAFPTDHWLSVMMGVGGWGWPISSSAIRSVAASLAFRKSAPRSVSLMEVLDHNIIVVIAS